MTRAAVRCVAFVVVLVAGGVLTARDTAGFVSTTCPHYHLDRRSSVTSYSRWPDDSGPRPTGRSWLVRRDRTSCGGTGTSRLLQRQRHHRHRHDGGGLLLFSSFYGKFDEEETEDDDEEEDDDDDDDDDEYAELGELDVASFRSKMSSLFGEDNGGGSSLSSLSSSSSSSSSTAEVDELIKFATASGSSSEKETKPWAKPIKELRPGHILLANPVYFCDDFKKSSPPAVPFLPFGGGGGNNKPDSKLLAKFGLTLPPPSELGPDRRADLLPVLVVVELGPSTARAVLLNRRTGYLLGDLEQPSGQPILEKFCIQPLWFGGVDASDSKGFDMLHLCPTVRGATQLTDDGLFWGGDPEQAQEAMEATPDRLYSGFDFKFFVQNSVFGRAELEDLVNNKRLIAVSAASSILFQSRDRMGTRRSKPLWTEIMELLGDEYQSIKDDLYDKKSS